MEMEIRIAYQPRIKSAFQIEKQRRLDPSIARLTEKSAKRPSLGQRVARRPQSFDIHWPIGIGRQIDAAAQAQYTVRHLLGMKKPRQVDDQSFDTAKCMKTGNEYDDLAGGTHLKFPERYTPSSASAEF